MQWYICHCLLSELLIIYWNYFQPADNSLDTLKKDASHSLIQLLESAAKEADTGSFEFQEISNIHLTAGAEALLSPFKIKDEIARQMMESRLLCLVCKQNFKSANELSQHLQVDTLK